MKTLRNLVGCILAAAALYACLNTVTPPGTCSVTVTVDAGRTASVAIEPMTLQKRLAAVASRIFSIPEANAYIPSIIATVRVTVTAADMATITTTADAAGLDRVVVPLEVQVGTARRFLVEGLSAAAVTTYTGQAVVDLNGLSAEIRIDMTPGSVSVPQLVSTDPADGAANVGYRPAITAVFSEAMDVRTITEATFLVSETRSGTPVSGAVLASGTTATFTPSADLRPNTDYTVIITNAVRSDYGIPLAQAAAWIFTTAPTVPFVTATSPAAGSSGVPLNAVITAAFSEPMDPLSITPSAFTVSGLTGTVTYNVPGRTATFAPAGLLASGTAYTATVTTAALSSLGVPMNADHVWSFTTGTTTDTTPPAFSGIASAATVSLTGTLLGWFPATDDRTPQAGIVYLVFRTTTSGSYPAEPAAVTPPGATSFLMTGLTPGTTYYFRVNARDEAGNVDANTVELSSTAPGVYVDAVFGSDASSGTAGSPFKTITHALSVITMNNAAALGIYAAAGWYDGPGNGEAFPLQLTPLTTLFCRGAGLTTVIDATGSGADAVYGNSASGIEGCRVIADAGRTGVDDRIGGEGGVPGRTTVSASEIGGPASRAAVFSTMSSMLSSTLTATGNTGILIRTGRPSVSGNVITGKQTAIEVLADTDPSIDANRIENNTAGIVVTAAGGRPSVRNNTISNNVTGIRVTAGAPLIHKNEVRTNTIAGNQVGIEIVGGMPTISFNTVTSNGVGVSVSGGTPAIRANSLFCNTGADLQVLINSVIDAQKNEWDHEPPTAGPAPCGPGTDVCYSVDPGGIPLTVPYGPAVPGGCQ